MWVLLRQPVTAFLRPLHPRLLSGRAESQCRRAIGAEGPGIQTAAISMGTRVS